VLANAAPQSKRDAVAILNMVFIENTPGEIDQWKK
jgi:hypothetical protein